MEHVRLPVFNTNAISIGFIQIKWYSLSYIISLALSWFIVDFCNKKYDLKLYDDKNAFSDDYFFYAVLGIVLGGRFGYVIFYNFEYFLKNPAEILEIWKGGMSFHGGFLGTIVALYLLAKKHKIDFFTLTDICAIATPIALFLGRIANFINLELYGRVSNVRWAMIFPFTDGRSRHPSQLYEALTEGLILFIIMVCLTYKKQLKVKGLNSAIFLVFYGIFRILMECFREPDLQLGFFMKHITMGQILSLPIFFGGLCLLFNKTKTKTRAE
jgi:phosphatidylglycerol:prolipoprotein diacylglycerol transferase